MRSRCSTLLAHAILTLTLTIIIILLLIPLRGIRPEDLVDNVDLPLGDGTVAQELRMQARMPRLMLYSSATTYRIATTSLRGAGTTPASSNTVAVSLIAIDIEGLEPGDKLVCKRTSTSLTLVNLLLVVCVTHSRRVGSASSLNLLEYLKKGLLYSHTVVLASPYASQEVSMLPRGTRDATLTMKVVIQVRNAPIADGDSRLANFARSDRGHYEGLTVRLRRSCECVVKEAA
ncbi:hypothetical protein Q7P35_005491 [Cladosporium inversicolor]